MACRWTAAGSDLGGAAAWAAGSGRCWQGSLSGAGKTPRFNRRG
jgi:hypothetical protein